MKLQLVLGRAFKRAIEHLKRYACLLLKHSNLWAEDTKCLMQAAFLNSFMEETLEEAISFGN